MSGEERKRRPVRIELATSEIEGGSCRSWADPAQVLTVVAVGHPEDTFARYVEPRLVDLESRTTLPADPDAGGLAQLPIPVQTLFARLQSIHERLYRENRSLMRDPRWVEITCAAAEEDRVYFVKASPAWICLLRDGHAYPAEREPPHAERRALGRDERLHLEVTSFPVEPGDTVLVLAAENDIAPDMRAVSNLFGQTGDLKRACDGLVNLLGLQSQGASAVALRFLPIGPQGDPADNPLSGLASIAGDATDGDAAIEGALAGIFGEAFSDPRPIPAARGGGGGPFAAWAGAFAEPAETPRATPAAPPDPAPETPVTDAVGEPEVAAVAVGAAHADPRGSETVDGLRPRRDPAPRVAGSRGRGLFWPVLLSVIGTLMVLLVAVPDRVGLPFRSPVSGLLGGGITADAPVGTLEVAPDPPARQVFLDGRSVADGTPARLAGVPAGRHTIGLDLGPCGIWETEVRVESGATARVAPRLTGSLEVVAADPAAGGKVWTRGRDKVPVPAVVDSLPVGWNRLFYEDERLPMWDRQVLIRAGQRTRVVVPNLFSSDAGRVKVEALVYRDRDGLVESRGDSIWIDGRLAGTAPLDVELPPGVHSVRVGSGSGRGYSEVLEVRAGGIRHVLAQLDPPVADLRHTPPGRVVVRGPVVLSLEVRGGDGPLLRPTLHLPEAPQGAREVPLAPLDEDPGVFVGVIDPANLPEGREIPYYFTVVGPSGQTIWSDLYHLRPASALTTNPAGSSPRAEPAVAAG